MRTTCGPASREEVSEKNVEPWMINYLEKEIEGRYSLREKAACWIRRDGKMHVSFNTGNLGVAWNSDEKKVLGIGSRFNRE